MQDTKERKNAITEAIRICLEKKIHFAAYRLPDKPGITIIIQKDPLMPELGNLAEGLPDKGFLIAPFSSKEDKTYLIRPEMLIHDPITPEQSTELNALPGNPSSDHDKPGPENTEREDYLRLIHETIEKIKDGEFEKVVLSRVKTVQGKFISHLTNIFNILCDSNPNAFVYLFCLNGQCWTGASPEPFICSRGNDLFTVSLAGTRSFHEEYLNIGNWNKKELLEQEYVTLHIEKILKTFAVTAYIKNGPYVAKAGNLLHLRTDFTFTASSVDNRLPSLIKTLHPTPAVCGMSPGKAMDFIRIAERHNREYYTGFLGPIGLDEPLQLYVNLRCMKILDNRLILYIGGGITHNTVPEDEWEETELKADTLLSALRKIW